MSLSRHSSYSNSVIIMTGGLGPGDPQEGGCDGAEEGEGRGCRADSTLLSTCNE